MGKFKGYSSAFILVSSYAALCILFAACGGSSSISLTNKASTGVQAIGSNDPDVLQIKILNTIADDGSSSASLYASMRPTSSWTSVLSDQFNIQIGSVICNLQSPDGGSSPYELQSCTGIDPDNLTAANYAALHTAGSTAVNLSLHSPWEAQDASLLTSSTIKMPISLIASGSSLADLNSRPYIASCAPSGNLYGLSWNRDLTNSENLILNIQDANKYQTAISDSGSWRPKKDDLSWSIFFSSAEIAFANKLSSNGTSYQSVEKDLPLDLIRSSTKQVLSLKNKANEVRYLPVYIFSEIAVDAWPFLLQGGCP